MLSRCRASTMALTRSRLSEPLECFCTTRKRREHKGIGAVCVDLVKKKKKKKKKKKTGRFSSEVMDNREASLVRDFPFDFAQVLQAER